MPEWKKDPIFSANKTKHMKNLNRFIAILLCVATFYQMFTAKTDQDLTLGFFTLIAAMLFMCFAIMAEQKEQIERLRKGIDAYQKSMKYLK